MSGVTKKLMSASGGVAGPVEAQAVDFDGTSDYLSALPSTLSGAVDSKQFTLSFFCYFEGGKAVEILTFNDRSESEFTLTTDGKIQCNLRDTQSTSKTCFEINRNKSVPFNTWFNLLISIDLTSTSRRHVILNDTDITSEVEFKDYLNQPIEFSNSEYVVAGSGFGIPAASFSGRLSNVFLDYTYRDLSVEANRRLFITDEGTPADGQASLSPILYLPMDDPADVGRNDGTGGNFTLNGIVARSGRGPNQYNAAASTFDGTADYLSKLGISATDGNTLTYRIVGKTPLTKAEYQITNFDSGGTYRFQFRWAQTSGDIVVFVRNSANTVILNFTLAGAVAANKYVDIAFSVDLSDSAKRHVFVDGVDRTSSVTWSTYTNDSAGLNGTDVYVGGDRIAAKSDGQLSSVYFATTYIDLSASNPFYDTETDKPKFLGEFGELPTGSAPLIYLPLRADDAGNNKGTGGDFTVNSGPYVGARGPSEFWGEAAEFNGTNQYLNRTSALSGVSDSSVISFAASVFIDNTAISPTFLNFQNSGGDGYLEMRQVNDKIRFESRDLTNTDIFELNSGVVFTSGTWHTILFCIDTSDSGATELYIDGVSESLTTVAFTSGNIPLSSLDDISIARFFSTYFDGKIGFLWFNTEYIDFSQEANRLKFFDAFGYPVDVGADGSLPTGNVPLIYMNEDFHLGTNLGSGGNFTPVNAPTDGGYVKG